MHTRIISGLVMTFAATVLWTIPAHAGSSPAEHGVRVHRLMEPQDVKPEPKHSETGAHQDVAPHGHRFVLHQGKRVVVRISDGFGRSKYRKQHPGVNRPWQDRRFGSEGRRYMNPKGLYTSKIYKRGYN